MVTETTLDLAAFKSIFAMAKALKDMDDALARKEAVLELQVHIQSAQAHHTLLFEKVRELEAQSQSLQTWQSEKHRYELKTLSDGVTAYALKKDAKPPEVAHLLCPDCYQQGSKSILQKVIRQPSLAVVQMCQHCGWEAYVTGAWDPEHALTKSSSKKPS